MPRGHDLTQISVSALAAELASGNSDALSELVRREGASLIQYATRILPPGPDAREAAEEAFERLWQNRGRLGPTTDLVRVLHTIMRSLARDRLRFRRAASGPHPISQARPRSSAAALLGLADRDLQDALHHALNTLSQRQREIVILRWNHRLTYEQIGVKLGIAPGTAAAHMQRAIAHLKAVLPLPLGDRSRSQTETG